MKQIRNLILFISTISLFFLSGCVTILQDMSVAEDGSGVLRFAIGVDSASYPQFVERMPEGYTLESFLAVLMQDDSITSVQEDQYEVDGRTWDSIQLEVSDFSQLFAEDRRVGPLTISMDQDEDVYTFTQTIDLAGSGLEIPGINLMNLTGAAYTVRLNSPQIIDTNGVQPTVDVSEWEIPLEELLQGDEAIYLEAEYTLEPYEGVFIPWEVFFPYVVIGFLAAGVLSILIVIIVNARQKDNDIQQIKF